MRSQSADWLWQSATYPYDKGGNILTASRNDETHTHTYGDADWADLLTAYDGQAITYDGSGNPLSYYNGTRYTFTWEEGRRLTSAVKNGSTYTYAYDLNGIRTSKVVDGVTHTYLYASGKLLREAYGDTVLDFFYDATGVPYAMNYTVGDTTTTYYYITNLQGDVIYMVDGTGRNVAVYEYDPYGEIITASGSMGQINPLRYRGYYYDSETGFYYLQSRYYDPSICRFINADDTAYLGADGSLAGYNLFSYCANNPLTRVDATGQSFLNAIANWWDGLCDDAERWLKKMKKLASSNRGTITLGINVAGAFGSGGAISLGLTFDVQGNIGLIGTVAVGGGMPSASISGFMTATSAPNIDKQAGMSTQTGGSASVAGVGVGGEYTVFTDSKTGEAYHGGTFLVGAGASFPVEFHGEAAYSEVESINIFDIALWIIDKLH